MLHHISSHHRSRLRAARILWSQRSPPRMHVWARGPKKNAQSSDTTDLSPEGPRSDWVPSLVSTPSPHGRSRVTTQLVGVNPHGDSKPPGSRLETPGFCQSLLHYFQPQQANQCLWPRLATEAVSRAHSMDLQICIDAEGQLLACNDR